MAGFREFVTGEVLTAANVDDFLAKQAVMKFADAAARDSALGTAVASENALREGMVAYLDDTDEVIKYDGTDWSSVAPATVIRQVDSAIITGTFTTSSTSFVDITNLKVDFTPTADDSLIIAILSLPHVDILGPNQAKGRIIRDATTLDLELMARSSANGAPVSMGGLVTFDTPNTTSEVEYQAQGLVEGNSASYRGGSLVIIEVAP